MTLDREEAVAEVTTGATTELEARSVRELQLASHLNRALAHELNNLLTGFGGCARAALAKLDEAHPARPFVAELHATAQRVSVQARLAGALVRAAGARQAPTELDVALDEHKPHLEHLVRGERPFELRLDGRGAFVALSSVELEALVSILALHLHESTQADRPLLIATSVTPEHVTLSMIEDADVDHSDLVLEDVTTGDFAGLGMSAAEAVLRRAGARVERERVDAPRRALRLTLPRVV